MVSKVILGQYLKALLQGDRQACRAVIEKTLQSGLPANSVYMDVIWPIMVEVESLFRDDRITVTQEHLATRINRTIVDQLQNKLPKKEQKSKKIAICCAPDEMQELGAQITADLFESDGWNVRFLGGGLTNDDVLAFVNEFGPDILLVYGTSPKQAPKLRQLIDTIKDVNAWPNMRIMLSGGLFNRADGLWQEIGADLFAPTALASVQQANKDVSDDDQPQERTIKRRKKRKANVIVEV
ncbi:MAG: cobalamin B12-binding domain-containing protein [Planctomycetota bacterium]|jgi:methanogenic corrinoid protein MtbC1